MEEKNSAEVTSLTHKTGKLEEHIKYTYSTNLFKVESHYSVWTDVCQRFAKSEKSSKRR